MAKNERRERASEDDGMEERDDTVVDSQDDSGDESDDDEEKKLDRLLSSSKRVTKKASSPPKQSQKQDDAQPLAKKTKKTKIKSLFNRISYLAGYVLFVVSIRIISWNHCEEYTIAVLLHRDTLPSRKVSTDRNLVIA